MYKLYGYAAIALCLAQWGHAAVNVTFAPTAPAQTQQEFIASVTAQYLSTVIPSPWFKDTYSLVISSKNPVYQPPIVSSSIPTATAVDQCMAYGFGQGLDSERYYNTQLVKQLQNADAGTCGFQTMVPEMTAATCASYCSGVYNVIVSTIQQRWGYIYTPAGVQVK